MPDAEYSFSWNVFPPCVRSVSIQLPQSGDSLRRRHRARCPCVEPPRSGFGECAQAVEVREACSCPRGIATTIQNGVHADQFSINRVIHSERKPFRQTASISENNCMQTGMNEKRVDIRKERIREIRAESVGLRFIEVITLDQVRFGFIEDLDLRRSFSRILSLAFSQSSNWAVPSAIRC